MLPWQQIETVKKWQRNRRGQSWGGRREMAGLSCVLRRDNHNECIFAVSRTITGVVSVWRNIYIHVIFWLHVAKREQQTAWCGWCEWDREVKSIRRTGSKLVCYFLLLNVMFLFIHVCTVDIPRLRRPNGEKNTGGCELHITREHVVHARSAKQSSLNTKGKRFKWML